MLIDFFYQIISRFFNNLKFFLTDNQPPTPLAQVQFIEPQQIFNSNNPDVLVPRHPDSVFSPIGDFVNSPANFDIFNPLGITSLEGLLQRVINGLLIIATPLVVIMILWSAYLFITAAGDLKKIQQARETILWTVVGYGILFLASGIVYVIKDLFS